MVKVCNRWNKFYLTFTEYRAFSYHIQCYVLDINVQHCRVSIANALEILQFCTKPLICFLLSYFSSNWNIWNLPPGMVTTCFPYIITADDNSTQVHHSFNFPWRYNTAVLSEKSNCFILCLCNIIIPHLIYFPAVSLIHMKKFYHGRLSQRKSEIYMSFPLASILTSSPSKPAYTLEIHSFKYFSFVNPQVELSLKDGDWIYSGKENARIIKTYMCSCKDHHPLLEQYCGQPVIIMSGNRIDIKVFIN